MRFSRFSALALASTLFAAIASPQFSRAEQIGLTQSAAIFSQGGFDVGNMFDNIYQNGDVGGAGWANNALGDNTAVAQTLVPLNVVEDGPTTLRFNLFHGGFPEHTIGKYRFSYTTDDPSTFANNLPNGGDVTATWIPIVPTSANSTGGPAVTMTIQPSGNVLVGGANPNLATDSVYATFGAGALPQGITGFRIEAIEDASFPANGPGRAFNGNYVARELDVAAFDGTKVALQNATSFASQGGFPVASLIDGRMPFTNAGGDGWADDTGGVTLSNVATFETTTAMDAVGKLTIEMLSGGFGAGGHTLGRFRISATTDDPSLFATGVDNAGAGAAGTATWTVLDPISFVADGTAILTEDAQNFITASGPRSEFEHYTIEFATDLVGITGFRLETPELANVGLPNNGPGRADNGNFVLREFSVFASPAAVPEPASIAIWSLLGLAAIGFGWRRLRKK